jgi:SAM-dependent methyltransferase
MSQFKSWETHYTRSKAALAYPDENCVRIVRPWLNGRDASSLTALDLGCGSGRHIAFLRECGIGIVCGSDIAMNALEISSSFGSPLVQCDNRVLPFCDSTFDLIVSWGSLHYGDKQSFARQVSELFRVLKPGGALAATLRSDRDTMMKNGKDLGNNVWETDLSDIKNSIVSFYSEDELQKGFSSFKNLSYGIMERTPLGRIVERISHWYFRADK